jgi:hypothetical protein
MTGHGVCRRSTRRLWVTQFSLMLKPTRLKRGAAEGRRPYGEGVRPRTATPRIAGIYILRVASYAQPGFRTAVSGVQQPAPPANQLAQGQGAESSALGRGCVEAGAVEADAVEAGRSRAAGSGRQSADSAPI